MAIKYFCDRCGKEVAGKSGLHDVAVFKEKNNGVPATFSTKIDAVCSDCERLHNSIIETLTNARMNLTERYWNNPNYNFDNYNAQLMSIEITPTPVIVRPKIGERVTTIKGTGVVVGVQCKIINDIPENYTYTVRLDDNRIDDFTDMQIWQIAYRKDNNDA